jgi:hypothetical protein
MDDLFLVEHMGKKRIEELSEQEPTTEGNCPLMQGGSGEIPVGDEIFWVNYSITAVVDSSLSF